MSAAEYTDEEYVAARLRHVCGLYAAGDATVLGELAELAGEHQEYLRVAAERAVKLRARWAAKMRRRRARYGSAATPFPRRAAVFERDGYRCRYCGEPVTLGAGHLDHILPRSRGGSNAPENLAASCASCNIAKGARTPDEWQAAIEGHA